VAPLRSLFLLDPDLRVGEVRSRALGALLRERGRSLARAPQLRATIREADASVQALIAAMQEAITTLEPIIDGFIIGSSTYGIIGQSTLSY
jgi:hypothetical protein